MQTHPKLHSKQKEVVKSRARFKVTRAGRRSGKTTLEIEEMSHKAAVKIDGNIFYIAPNQTQARDIIWEDLKSRLAGVGIPNESRLEMKLPNKHGGYSIISLAGWEKRENFRGKKADLIVFDELDTMRDFFIGWKEIFKPALLDTRGDAHFIGTPKKENPNLQRLEKEAAGNPDWECFHFKTIDNPIIPIEEVEKAREDDFETYQQEYLAEYITNQGSLFSHNALVDVFSNTVEESNEKFLIVDVAGDGSDKTVFSFWRGLEEYKRISYDVSSPDDTVQKIKVFAQEEKIPYSNIAIDAIGIGEGIANSSLLTGVVGFKSSFTAIKTDKDIVNLPNVGTTKNAPLISNYKNLRSQCIFKLANYVNNHKIASLCMGAAQEKVIEELFVYQDASKGDGKTFATSKDDVKKVIGRSPDESDCFIMRMYFELRASVSPHQSAESKRALDSQLEQFARNKRQQKQNSSR